MPITASVESPDDFAFDCGADVELALCEVALSNVDVDALLLVVDDDCALDVELVLDEVVLLDVDDCGGVELDVVLCAEQSTAAIASAPDTYELTVPESQVTAGCALPTVRKYVSSI